MSPHHAFVHFTPPHGWMNDPNGLVFADGRWQLFYQHNPHDVVWDAMHWGSAVSDDLLTWHHRDIALRPGAKGVAFSGSAVVDETNSAGFGDNAIVSVFTQVGERQSQALAFSVDGGNTFEEYAHNPVLEAPPGIVDFRDPKVFRHNDLWMMALCVEQGVWFYASHNLCDWQKTGEFGDREFATERAWETPDVFLLPVEGTHESVWVLTIGVQDEAPLGGSGTRYWVGNFADGTFVAAQEGSWADLGPDFYAPQSWNNAPDGKRTWIGWMNNSHYSHSAPVTLPDETDPAVLTGERSSRGVLSCPRVLSIRCGSNGLHLVQRPVEALRAAVCEAVMSRGANDGAERNGIEHDGIEHDGIEPDGTEHDARETVMLSTTSTVVSATAGEDVVVFELTPERELGLDDLIRISLSDLNTSAGDSEVDQPHVELTITEATVSITRNAWASSHVVAPMNCRSDAFVGSFRSILLIVGRTTVECFINDGEVVFSALTGRRGSAVLHADSARAIACSVVATNLAGTRLLAAPVQNDPPTV
jgi:sucrose-6-phosphate hydrolase SacC (GH32 family)